MIAAPVIDCLAAGVLVSTDAVDLAAHNPTTTYAAAATCSYASHNWTSVQDNNIGHTPGTDVSWWVDDGLVNSLNMFDSSVQTATTHVGGFGWTLAPGRVTFVGLMGLVGNAVTLTVRDGLGGEVIFTDTQSLQIGDGTYYDFCFEEFTQRSDVSWSGLPGSTNAHVTIDIEATGAAACGLCGVGKQVFLGTAITGFAMPIEDRGRQYLDRQNNPVTVERGFSRNCTGTLRSTPDQYNRLIAFYSANINDPFFWVAAPGIADLVSASGFGKITRVVPAITQGRHTTSIEIAGFR